MKDDRRKFSLLFVDDDPLTITLLEDTFFDEDYHIHTALNGQDALACLSTEKIDVAFIDLKMPGMDGITLLKEVKSNYPEIMVMMLTGYGSIEKAIEAIKMGAVDFLEKPFSPEALRSKVAQLHQIWKLKEENRKLRSRMDFQFGFDRLVGNSTAILKLKEMIIKVSPIDVTVLIQGETGTGKELVARAIHYHSPQSENNFVPVDCAAISETVMESELFGHVKGAFTDAHASTLGLIRSADKGTLFLDEVSELSPSIQVKLLRTIQEREVRPVGESKTYHVDVRVLVASNRNLADEVARGTFREDLFFRLNVVTVNVPPLRERREDIPLLARFFLKRFSTGVSPVKYISGEAFFYLENYEWPGNIRELENVIRRAVALGKYDVIVPEDLPLNIYTPPEEVTQDVESVSDDSMEVYERTAIKNALAKSGNNRRQAAQILGIGEATLYRKISKYRIDN